MLKHGLKTIPLTVFLILVAGCGATPTPLPATARPTALPPTVEPTPTAAPTTEPPPTAPPLAEPVAITPTWFKTYGGDQDDMANDILMADDGGYYIVGGTNVSFGPVQRGDVFLIRTDPAGEVLWEKTYGGERYDMGGAIVQTSDGGLLISGESDSFGDGDMDVYLIKVDPDGNELWSRTFGGPLDERGGAWPTDDGGYILGGNIVDPNDPVVDDPGTPGYGGYAGRSNIYLARIDADGNELWSRTFGGENNVLATGGAQAPDGGFLILATVLRFPDNDDDIYLLKVDQNGDEVWSRTWESGISAGYDLIPTADGNYLLTGPHSPPAAMDRTIIDFLFIKVDPQGNEIWSSTFGDPEVIDYAYLLAETPGGGYVAAGTRASNLMTWDEDIVLVQIDQSGQRLGEGIIETSTHSMFGAMLQHPDGEFVIAGTIYYGGDFDIFLIKAAADPTAVGSVPACPPAGGEGTVSPAVSIDSVVFLVNGVEQVVREGDTLQASPGDQVRVSEVMICGGPFSGNGGEACVDFAPVDQSGQEIGSEHRGTHTVRVTPGLMSISWNDDGWTVGEDWAYLSAVLNHWPPDGTEDPDCGDRRCERDDRMIVELR